MVNLQMQNNGNGAVFNIRYTRKTVLLSVDFSFYNQMDQFDNSMSIVLYFNSFFAAMKKVCSRYNGEFLYIDGDSCVFGFGRYCGVNPERIACICAMEIRHLLAEIMKDIFPGHKVLFAISVHSADINFAVFSETGKFRSHVCGANVAVLQEMNNVCEGDDILISESVYKEVCPYTECEYFTDVTVRNYGKTKVYRLKEFLECEKSDSPFVRTISRDIYDTLSALTEQLYPDDKVLVIENEAENMPSDFFDQFYADRKELFVYHSVVSEYGRNFYYDILNDLYNITESIIMKEEVHGVKSLKQYLDYLKQVFNFNPTDYKTIASYKASVYSFVMILNALAKLRKIVIVVEHIDLLDNESIALLNQLIDSTKKSQVYFIFTSNDKQDNLDCRLSAYHPLNNLTLTELETFISATVGDRTDNIHELNEYLYRITQGSFNLTSEMLDYMDNKGILDKLSEWNDIPDDEDELIKLRLSPMNEDEKNLTALLSLLGSFVELDFVRYLTDDADNIVNSLADKGILRKMMRNNETVVTFCRSEYAAYIRDDISEEQKRSLHQRIAETYERVYRHNLPKYYEKIAYHYQCADILDKAVYYVFCTAVNYREQQENSKARDLILSAIVLGKEIQDEDDSLHYFTDNHVQVYDYINHQRFGKFKWVMRLSLDVMYYYYAKTFDLIDAEASVYFLKAYEMSKQYHNDFITVVSSIHYFIYNAYTAKQACYEYLEEATQLARNNHDIFMELFAQLSYIDAIFAECRDRTKDESMIMSHFFNVKSGMKVGNAYMPLSRDKTIHALYYANYAYYLKHKEAGIDRIIYAVHKVETYLTNDIDRVAFYKSIATGFGPLVGTPYQLLYTKKNLNIAKRQKHIPMVAQFKATVGYLYMLDGQYKKALYYHKSAKEISKQTNDIHEVHMAFKNLGDLCNCLERYADAVKFYRKCLDTPIIYDDSHKRYVDFSDPVFPKSALAFTLIKIGRLEEAEKYIKEVELSMSNIFFGNEIPIFLKFLRCYLSLILEEYDDETIKIMKNCYFDMKQLNPGAVQLVWMKRELSENGIELE